jgi:hypothetical protein
MSYGKWIIDIKSRQAIHEWCIENRVKNPLHESELHVTIYIDKDKNTTQEIISYSTPVSAKVIDVIHVPGALALLLKSPEAEEKRYAIINNRGISHEFPDYLMHVSVSYNSNKELYLNYPDITLQLLGEVHEEFKVF